MGGGGGGGSGGGGGGGPHFHFGGAGAGGTDRKIMLFTIIATQPNNHDFLFRHSHMFILTLRNRPKRIIQAIFRDGGSICS